MGSDQKKFRLLTEREVGRLPVALRRRWKLLLTKQEEVEALQEKVADRASKLMDEIEEHIRPQLAKTTAQTGFQITKDGEVVQTFCSCPHCQAQVQGMMVSQVVEEMIKIGHLSEMDDIARARAAAAKIDGRHRRMLLN